MTLDSPQVGLVVFVTFCVLSSIVVSRLVRSWVLAGILAGPAACVLFFTLDTILKGHLDKFIFIAGFVALGFSFVVTLPTTLLGFLWRRDKERRKAARVNDEES